MQCEISTNFFNFFWTENVAKRFGREGRKVTYHGLMDLVVQTQHKEKIIILEKILHRFFDDKTTKSHKILNQWQSFIVRLLKSAITIKYQISWGNEKTTLTLIYNLICCLVFNNQKLRHLEMEIYCLKIKFISFVYFIRAIFIIFNATHNRRNSRCLRILQWK